MPRCRTFDAIVVAVDPDEQRVALDRTAFYATGGGQPHDTGVLTWDGGEATVVDVRKSRDGDEHVWHTLDGDEPSTFPRSARPSTVELDWDRRHALMRTHTALHVLCGVIWNEWGTAVTGGNMEPLSARMDFEFDPLPEGFGPRVEELVNAELAADRPIEVSFLPAGHRGRGRGPDPHEGQPHPRVGARDPRRRHRRPRQAGRRRHARRARTGEVGRIRVVKTESKGKGNKRIRIEVLDA